MALRCGIALVIASLAFSARATEDLPARGHLHFGAGSFKPSEDGELRGRDGTFSIDIGFGARHSRRLAWEIGYLYYHQSTDTPAALRAMVAGTGSDQSGLSVSGLGGLAKLMQPAGPFDFYVGAGLGWYESELSASGVNFLSFRATSASRSDSSWGSQFVAGVDIRASSSSTWTFQYRRMVVNPNFGPGIGTVSAGGSMWQIFYRAGFGRCAECGG